jgi:pentapeptide MXKDX repeat protein
MKIVALFQIGFSPNRDTLDVRDNSNIRINSLIYSDQSIQKELSKGRNKTMNWKTLSLIAGLILTTSLTACSSSPASNNQIAPEASPAMSKDKAGDAMGKDAMGKDAMGKDAMGKDAMGKDKAGGAMGKDAMGKDAMGKDAMGKDKAGDAMKQSPASTKP